MQLIKIAYMYLAQSEDNANKANVNKFLLDIEQQQSRELKDIK